MAVQLDDVMSEVHDAIDALCRRADVHAAFLFGSQADRTAGPDSDIDLAVFVDGVEDWDIDDEVRVCSLVRRAAGNRVELHFFCATDLKDPEPASFAAYVQEHGVRLKLDKPY